MDNIALYPVWNDDGIYCVLCDMVIERGDPFVERTLKEKDKAETMNSMNSTNYVICVYCNNPNNPILVEALEKGI